MTKTERKEIEIVLAHAEEDIHYGGGGSYNLRDDENTFDAKEAAAAKRGIQAVRWILTTYLD